MSRRAFTFIELLLAGSALSVAAAPQKTPETLRVSPPGTSAPAASPMRQDARLKRLVSMHEVGITLDDLLHKLSANGLTLSADQAGGSRKLQIRLNRKPLSALMQSLAQLMPGSWETNGNGSGYTFVLSAKIVSLGERWWELFLKERAQAKEAQRRFILQKMQAPPVRHKIYHNSTDPENEDLEMEKADLLDQEFFPSLPPGLQEQIADQIVENDLQSELAIGGTDEGSIIVPLTELPQHAQEILRLDSKYINHHSPQDVLVRFTNFAYTVRVSLIMLDQTPPGMGDSISLGIDLCPEASILSLTRDITKYVQRLSDNAPAACRELAAYQQSRVWSNDPPPPINSQGFPPTYRADVLDWLADRAGVDLVSDDYSIESTPMSAQEKASPLARSVKVELDRLAKLQDLSWRRSGSGIYLIRNNRWYRDDALEVPSALLQRWLAQYQALPVPPTAHQKGAKAVDPDADPAYFKARMDWEAEIVSNLTDWQIGSGFAWAAMERTPASPAASTFTQTPSAPHAPPAQQVVYPFAAIGLCMRQELGTLRFYAGLDETQRAGLLAGRLPMISLSLAQQEQVLYLSPTLRYTAGNQPVWLGLQSWPRGAYLGADGCLPPGGSLHLVAIPVR